METVNWVTVTLRLHQFWSCSVTAEAEAEGKLGNGKKGNR